MNDNAKKWVAELRSGKYEQGQSMLRENDKFCCLGVACELAVEAGIIPPATQVKGLNVYWYMNEIAYLPIPVAEWLGLQSRLGSDGEGTVLTALNDSGTTFTEIADIIEQTPGLFQTEEEEG